MTPARRGLVCGWFCAITAVMAGIGWAAHLNAYVNLSLTLGTVVNCVVAWTRTGEDA